jgi:hypothetical protein
MYRLNIHDVQRRMHEKSEKKVQCYEKILAFCHKRILSNVEREHTKCVFEFPEYVIGFPLFDMNACMEHCKRHLISSGFLVHYHFPNKFYISWDIEEIKAYKTQQRKQTMLSAVVAPKAIEEAPPSQQPTLPKHRDNLRQVVIQAPPTKTPLEMKEMQPLPQQYPTPIPKALSHIPNDLLQKITKPLPSAPLIYNPNDVYNVGNNETSVLDNTFFPNNLKHMLVSDIGNNKSFSGSAKYNQKASGKLSLNI